MSGAHELSRGHKQLRGLIEFALQHGWEVVRTPGGHLKFTKPGLPPIYTGSNVLRAIPVQAGGLFPITDVWYIEPSLDAPDRLRIHIAQFAREIAEEAKLADCVESIESGIGFTCSASLPATSVVPPFGRAVLALLQMLTLDHPSSQAAPCLDELGVLLQGDRPGRPVTIPRLSDTGLVKLFRLLRLARRLVELEAGPDDASEG